MSVFFRSRPTRMEPEEVVRRLADVLPEPVAVVLDAGAPVVRWHDGIAPSVVAEAVGGVVNWPVVSPGARTTDGPVVVLDRSLSDAALAVAVVRYAGSHVRPYTSTDERAVADLAGLLDVEGPAASGYPMADTMAGLLLAAAEPGAPSGETRADRLSAKLTALGYDELWKVAWTALT